MLRELLYLTDNLFSCNIGLGVCFHDDNSGVLVDKRVVDAQPEVVGFDRGPGAVGVNGVYYCIQLYEFASM